MLYLKFAWRNLWRNSRRTLITVASIFFGVFFAVFMSSLQKGSLDNMIENISRFYSGHLQIQQKDFKESHNLNNSFIAGPELIEALEKNNNITQYTQRVESFALACSDDGSYASMIFGIIPQKENSISEISKWISAGRMINPQTNEVMIGKDLAGNLKIGINDTLILLGQGYHGVSAAGLFPVVGLLDFPISQMDKNMVYMDIASCRDFFSMPSRSTSIVIMGKNTDIIANIQNELKSELPSNLTIYSWKELQEGIQNLIEGKMASGKVIKGILFMVIGFGIWGTIIMLMAERKRELGIMIALGVKKTRAIILIAIESLLIGVLGILAGFAISLPIVLYFFRNPIHIVGEAAKTYTQMGFEPKLVFSIQPAIFINPAITIFVIFGILTLYPFWFILKLKAATALRA